jgi:formylglycine-generating enzyme required for sulfatase activity/serine/threonine protein kinase
MTYPKDTLLFRRKYRVEKYLGRGAFGEVYQVTHQGLNLPRALKILRRDAAGVGSEDYRKAAERFNFEARLGARLQHKNVVRVWDWEEEEEGQELGLVMEYAEGGSLLDRLGSGQRLGEEAVTRLVLDLCAGLQALHKLRAVHRDIKPGNILFAKDGRALLADLGLAQIPDDNSRRSLLGSLAGAHPGTPLYMSPEQVNSLAYLQPASDIYSLGCVMYEALSGAPYKTRHARPGRPLPAWLEPLLARMLAEETQAERAETDDPTRRYRGVAQLHRELKQAWEQEKQRRLEKRRTAEDLAQARTRLESELAEARQQLAGLTGQFQESRQAEASLRAALLEKTSQLEALTREHEAEKQAHHETRRQLESARQAEAEAQARLAALEQERKQAEAKERAAREEQARQEAEKQRRQQEMVLELAPGVTMEFVRVPAGEFTMGSDKNEREKPIHKVTLPEYLIGKYPVTNRQFEAFVTASGYRSTAELSGSSFIWDTAKKEWEDTPGASWRQPRGRESSLTGKQDHPVVHISWKDAAAYCDWISKMSALTVRLPSEAEWEKAARGTDGRDYPWGSQAPDDKRCNYNGNVKDTSPVGKYSPQGDSPYGCVDMAGNVWEWTADWYQSYPGNKVANAEYGEKYRVLRGGCWFNLDDYVRTAYRLRGGPTNTSGDAGFRCACGTPS